MNYFIRVGVLAAAVATMASARQTPSTRPAAESTFLVFLRSTQIGTEEVVVTQDADGWTIASAGRMGRPIELITKSLRIRYAPDWKPLELTLDATLRGQALGMHITVADATATTHVNNAGQPIDRTDPIEPDAMLLPNPLFAAYEAVARRLTAAAAGSTIPVYQGGPVPVMIRVGESEIDRIQTVGQLIEARRTRATLVAADIAEALRALHTRVDAAVAELRTIDPTTLSDFRSVGRARLPSTVIGCLVHGAEHSMRHVGQLSVTTRIARAGGAQ